MPVDESKFAHIRVPEPQSSDLRKLAGIERRTAQAEGLIAVEKHLAENRNKLKKGPKTGERTK